MDWHIVKLFEEGPNQPMTELENGYSVERVDMSEPPTFFPDTDPYALKRAERLLNIKNRIDLTE